MLKVLQTEKNYKKCNSKSVGKCKDQAKCEYMCACF